jgi:hypothetical protein
MSVERSAFAKVAADRGSVENDRANFGDELAHNG